MLVLVHFSRSRSRSLSLSLVTIFHMARRPASSAAPTSSDRAIASSSWRLWRLVHRSFPSWEIGPSLARSRFGAQLAGRWRTGPVVPPPPLVPRLRPVKGLFGVSGLSQALDSTLLDEWCPFTTQGRTASTSALPVWRVEDPNGRPCGPYWALEIDLTFPGCSVAGCGLYLSHYMPKSIFQSKNFS